MRLLAGEFKNSGYEKDFIANKFPSFLIILSHVFSVR